MLNIHFFTFNPFQENTYVIANEKGECWIIDPGMYDAKETDKFIAYLEKHTLMPQAIINTHTHIDHIFGVQALIDKYAIPFGVHEKDLPVLNSAAGSAALFGLDFGETPQPSFFIKENELLTLGDDTVEVRFTPGHSPGSIVFYYPNGNWVIAGDVLFNRSIGRTDLPGGDMKTLITSIETQLFTLPKQTIVYPGHGPSTVIADEMKDNPFLQ
jgi:hydroxyacylglutathione hydrolase